uniref:Putative secreted protein n=1 Tax=Anopheles darlingi TaxID=43151 RepID=A0A2M4D1K0_ANODA
MRKLLPSVSSFLSSAVATGCDSPFSGSMSASSLLLTVSPSKIDFRLAGLWPKVFGAPSPVAGGVVASFSSCSPESPAGAAGGCVWKNSWYLSVISWFVLV